MRLNGVKECALRTELEPLFGNYRLRTLGVLNRKSQPGVLGFGTQSPKSHWPLSFSAPKSQRLISQRLQDANVGGGPLQNLVRKRFSEFSLVLLCRAVGILGWSLC